MHPYQSYDVEPNWAYQFAQLSDLLIHYLPMATTKALQIKTNIKKEKKITTIKKNLKKIKIVGFFFLSFYLKSENLDGSNLML